MGRAVLYAVIFAALFGLANVRAANAPPRSDQDAEIGLAQAFAADAPGLPSN